MGRVLEEVVLQGGGVADEFADRPAPLDAAQAGEAAVAIGVEVAPDGAVADARERGALGLGVAVVVEPDDFHSLLDQRDGMVVAVVGDLRQIVGRDGNGSHRRRGG